MPASGSACAANVAFGAQNVLQASHPFPVSQAAKKSLAIAVIEAMTVSLVCLQQILALEFWLSFAPSMS
jgi:hypothetical protein